MVYQRSSSLTTVSSLLSHRPVSLVMERSPRFESLILREKKTVFTNLKKQILEEPSVHLEIRFLGQCSKYFPLLLKIPEIFLAMSHMHMHTHARVHTHTHTHTHTIVTSLGLSQSSLLRTWLCVWTSSITGVACYTYNISGPTPDPLNQTLHFNEISRCFICSNIIRI